MTDQILSAILAEVEAKKGTVHGRLTLADTIPQIVTTYLAGAR